MIDTFFAQARDMRCYIMMMLEKPLDDKISFESFNSCDYIEFYIDNNKVPCILKIEV